jgi:peptidoglycan hydrolase CwlO-like protein
MGFLPSRTSRPRRFFQPGFERSHRGGPGLGHPPRLARRLAVALLAATAVAVAAPGGRGVLGVRLADSYTQRIAALQAQYNQVGSQIGALHGQEAQVSAQVAAVQSQIAQTQTRLAAVQSQITQLNLELAETQQAIITDTAHLESQERQLSRLMIQIYTVGGTNVVDGLVDSKNINEFMDQLDSATTVSNKFQQLITEVRADQARLEVLKAEQQGELDQANNAQTQLQTLQSQLQVQQAQLTAQEAALTGQAAVLASQRNVILGQISQVRAQQRAAEEAAAAAAARAAAAAAARARGGSGGGSCGGALCPFAFGPEPDGFPYGQCTWYVASLRYVDWSGNADDWFANAQAAGHPTGSTPRPGAIVVWGPGNGYSSYGHVAYVRYVSGPSDFTVDEDNWFDTAPNDTPDQREVTTLWDVEGFIY